MREKSHLLSEKNPKNRYMSFVVEKKWTCLVGGLTWSLFIAFEVPSFHESGKCLHIGLKSLSCQDKIFLTHQSKISLTYQSKISLTV
jgi:hypothetical protein